MLFSRKVQKPLREMAAEFIFQNSPDAYLALIDAAVTPVRRRSKISAHRSHRA